MGGNEQGKGRRALRFGGDWTEQKLIVLENYLRKYTTALKNQPFKKAYIDAFAGTGYRDASDPEGLRTSEEGLLFPELAGPEPQRLLEGSARRALRTEPPFDKYILIEESAQRCSQLERLKVEFPSLASDIEIQRGDANEVIRRLCRGKWTSHRAVLFLDPFGMQVEWETIKAIGATKAIDMWLLFPQSAVNRLLMRSGEIPVAWRQRMTRFWGNGDWFDELYQIESKEDLFGRHERLNKMPVQEIGRKFKARLQEVFAAVAEPGVLANSKNCPLYLLCFAAGNPQGAKVALKIAPIISSRNFSDGLKFGNRVDPGDLEPCDRLRQSEPGVRLLLRGTDVGKAQSDGPNQL